MERAKKIFVAKPNEYTPIVNLPVGTRTECIGDKNCLLLINRADVLEHLEELYVFAKKGEERDVPFIMFHGPNYDAVARCTEMVPYLSKSKGLIQPSVIQRYGAFIRDFHTVIIPDYDQWFSDLIRYSGNAREFNASRPILASSCNSSELISASGLSLPRRAAGLGRAVCPDASNIHRAA